ncbi:MAG TPA: C4-dicarboxylate ABC transporter, partial [Candidatus Aphodousia faecipullorum]|nr:C4-dicarboxylate ABC transporter [Candidatus Aphodousia faecipullorum]
MTFSMIGATVVVILTIVALLKRYETRLVLITAGLAMGVMSLAPHIALANMMKNMTNASMILAICSSLGFAAVVSMTRCDVHFVALLVKPL